LFEGNAVESPPAGHLKELSQQGTYMKIENCRADAHDCMYTLPEHSTHLDCLGIVDVDSSNHSANHHKMNRFRISHEAHRN
jgi:hypothetical protein